MGIMASSLLIQGLSGHRGHESESICVFGARPLEILETGSTPSGSSSSSRSSYVVKSDGDDLKKMVKLFDEGKLKVCVDEHFAFDEVKEALSKSLTARSGGKLVIDVASPAPSETCCVVA